MALQLEEETQMEDRRIEFVRPDPTKFVLLVARTGRGTGIVAGTETFKPAGTEWATDRDLRDAGYVPASEVVLPGKLWAVLKEVQQAVDLVPYPNEATESFAARVRQAAAGPISQIKAALR